MCVATSTIIGISVAAGTAGAGIYAAHEQSGAAKDAAKTQADASTHAADIQSKAADEQLAFQRQQAENDWRNQQQTQQANYNQWAAGRGRLRSLGAMTGIDIGADPAYVPGIDPRFDTGASPLPSSTTASPTTSGPPTSAPTGPVDGSAASISAFFKSKGVPDTETPYWVSKWPELVARGQELGDPDYAMKRLAAADIFGGGGGAAAPASAAPLSMAGIVSPLTPTSTSVLPPVSVQPYQQARRVFSFADLNGAR